MSPKKVTKNSRPYNCSLKYTKILLSLGWALMLILPTWAGSAFDIQAEIAQAAFLPDTPNASLVTAPHEVVGTALQPRMQFEPNLGQTDPQVHFMARGVGYTVFLTPTEAILVLPAGASQPDTNSTGVDTSTRAKQIIQLQVLEANPTPDIRGVNETPTTVHRLIGADPAHWQTHIPVYAQVRYDAIYPGIDLLYYGNQDQLEYDFIVHPGADPSAITLGIQGADAATLEADGHLRLSLPGGTLRLQKPMLSQTVNGQTTDIPGHFLLRESAPSNPRAPIQVAFAVGAYDPTLPLIIDPLVNYASAFGGEGHDLGEAITVDSAGHGYVVGTTESFTFPVTPQALQDAAVGTDRDVFVTKFDTDTSEILFSTYIGGEGHDRATAVAVDAQGMPYVTGETTSLTFPTQHPLQATLQGSSDAFVLKLATDGSSLLYSTYLGGSGSDHANEMVVNEQGQATLTGMTTSPDFPMMHAPDTSLGHGEAVPQSDVFVSTLDAQGAALQFSTFLGGAGADIGHDLTLDAQGMIYLTGETTKGAGFPVTSGAFQPTYGGGATDAFIAKINPFLAGTPALQYASYLGGSGQDVGLALLIDAQQHAFITGWTTGQGPAPAVAAPRPAPVANAPVGVWGRRNGPPAAEIPARGFRGGMRGFIQPQPAPPPAPVSQVAPPTPLPEFPVTPNAYDATFNGEKDAFIAQVNMVGRGPSALAYASYVGGSQADTGIAIGVDSLDRVCIAGTTASTDYPVKNALADHDTFHGGTDGFVTKFHADPTTLLFSSFLGGSGQETITDMGLDAGNNAYLTGQTRSTDFPLLTSLHDTPLTGEPQALLVKVQDPVTLRLNFVGPLSPAPRVGEISTFGLEWTNLGPDEATGVQLELDFTGISPDILRYVSITNTGGSSNISNCSGSALPGPGGTLTCDVGNIPPTNPAVFNTASVMVEALVVGSFSPNYDAEITANELDATLNTPSVATASIGNIDISPAIVDLTVDFQGSGTGSVVATPGPSSSTATIQNDATLAYDSGTMVSIVATPTGAGPSTSDFNGWTGSGCTSPNSTITVNMTQSRTCNATFNLSTVTVPDVVGQTQAAATAAINAVSGLSVGAVTQATSASVPSGSVISQNPGPGQAPNGSTVALVVSTGPAPVTVPNVVGQTQAAATAAINGVSGLSVGAVTQATSASVPSGSVISQNPGPGQAPNGSTVALVASLGPVQRTLTVTPNPNGTITGPNIDCGGDCTETVNNGTSVALNASPSAGFAFSSWSGCDSTSGSQCVVTLTSNRSVTAAFAPIPRTLTVTSTGSGNGTVTGTGINCGSDCTHTANNGTQITLTASPNPSFFFTGWSVSGSPAATCPGTGTCTITLNTNRTVTATFAANQAPAVEAGPNQVINLPAGANLPINVTLNGTVTDDGLPTLVTPETLWRLLNGPAVISDIANNVMPTMSFPALGSYTMELSANDSILTNADTVIITINDPSAAQVLVPNVVGQPETAAAATLTTVNLTLGTITQELNATVTAGSVIRQTPIGGAFANEGTPVNLVISSGTGLLITTPTDGPDATPGDGVCETSAGTGVCSLRAAIQEANTFPGQQTITLPPDTYTLTLAGENEDAAATGDLDITDDLIIESSTGIATQTIISGNALDRVFDLPPGRGPNVTLHGLTIQGGLISGSTGGGLRNAQGILTVENSVVTANETNGSGGGVSHLGGTLTLRNTQVTNNTSEGLGGGLQTQGGTVSIDGNTRFTGNTANFGGGLSTGGADVTLSNVQIEGNTAVGDGAGIYKFLSPGDLLGSIQAPRVALSNTTVRNNTLVGGDANDCAGYIVNVGNNTFGTTAGCTLLAP